MNNGRCTKARGSWVRFCDGDAVLVLTLVGTDHHPFDRLVSWVDAWSFAHPDVECLVQYGTSQPPRHADGRALFSHAEIRALLGRADVVVCHGGPSTIIEARRSGLRPIAVPRTAELDEHVDNHQGHFVARLAAAGLVRAVYEEDDFEAALAEWCASPLKARLVRADRGGSGESVRRFGAVVSELFSHRRRR